MLDPFKFILELFDGYFLDFLTFNLTEGNDEEEEEEDEKENQTIKLRLIFILLKLNKN